MSDCSSGRTKALCANRLCHASLPQRLPSKVPSSEVPWQATLQAGRGAHLPNLCATPWKLRGRGGL